MVNNTRSSSRSGGIGTCGSFDACPRSWSSGECNDCWPFSSSMSSGCPTGWCPLNFSSRCHNWQRCPKSHCPSMFSRLGSNGNRCDNWGDCCNLWRSNPSNCFYNPSGIKF